MQLAAVRPVHLQKVLDEARASRLSPRSVVQIHRIMHAAFRTAQRWQLLATNPSDGVTPPKIEQAKLTVPSPTDVARLLMAADERHRTAMTIAAGTGLRRGELLALVWADIDLEDRPRLHVTGTLQRDGAALVRLPPKTERSRRVVPLPPSLAETLRRHRAEQNERRLHAGPAWHAGDFVFDNGTGAPVDPDAFGKAFRSAARRVGLDGVRLHDLRHGFASMLIGAGTGVRIMADLLGHSTVSFTLQTYTHPSEEEATAAMAEAEQLIGEKLDPWGESGANRSRMSGVRALSAGTEPQVTVRIGTAWNDR